MSNRANKEGLDMFVKFDPPNPIIPKKDPGGGVRPKRDPGDGGIDP